MKLEMALSRRIGDFLLEPEVCFDAPIAALCGPSAAGKSLTLQAIVGALSPDTGVIRVDGATFFDSVSGLDLAPRERRVGYVPQSYALFPHLTAARNVAFGLADRPEAEARREVDRLLALLSLEGAADRLPAQLSGGQQQRVALARALAVRPRLLLLDEPFAALDPGLRGETRDLVRRVQREIGVGILLVSHDVADAHELADVVSVLEAGRVLQCGPRDEVFQRPASLAVARWVGARNLVEMDRVGSNGHGARLVAGALELEAEGPVPAGPRVVAVLRPERLRLLAPLEDAQHDEIATPVTVRRVQPQGAHWLVEVGAGDPGPLVQVDAAAWWCERHRPAPGACLRLAIPRAAVHLLPPA